MAVVGGSGSGGMDVRLDARDMQRLYADLRAAQSALTKDLRTGVKKAAEPIKSGAQSRAGFSRRIPRTVKVKASFSARNPSVSVTAGGPAAPNAAPINNRGQGGTFRHPVYGHRDTWVTQRAHPFMTPSSGEIHAAEGEILSALDEIARKAGFR